ncbi:TPA: hypothetical protein MFD56_003223 [Klebsiella pneumoniae]|nr:hypothetical protein [Klebsiella pneumoniae]HBW7488313.1 hypothetical protein [Klebsiella pneumoniae]HBW7777639.1 hypothetical protein [Klebsiella pneumoniae]HBW7989679.1 hypothetical protein [Klebsiella pneumoniae]HBW8016878.1 hypothetical protein [Klebsiella pneumoniae]
MTRIVLCCAAGMSTSMLVNKMKAEAQQRALALEIYAVAVAVIDMADYGMMRGAAVLDKALALLEH